MLLVLQARSWGRTFLKRSSAAYQWSCSASNSTDVEIHHHETSSGVIFTGYVHRFRSSNGRGARVVHRMRCINLAMLPKQSHSLGAGYWGYLCECMAVATSFQRYSWSIISAGSCAVDNDILYYSLFHTLALSFYFKILSKIHLLLF